MIRIGRRTKVVLQFLVVALIFGILFRILGQSWTELETHRFTLRPDVFALATCVVLVGFIYWFVLWHVLTIRMGVSLPVGRALSAYYFSQIGKYLPGKVWMMAARFYAYRKAGRSGAVVSVAVILEGFYHVAGQAVLFLAASAFSDVGLPSFVDWLAPFVIAVGLVLLHPRLLERILNAVLRLARRDPIRIRLSYLDLLGFLILYASQYLVLYTALFLLIDSVYPIAWSRFADVCLAGSTTGLVSMFAILAPAGLGVREGMLFVTLRMIVPESYAVILSLLNRIWGTSIEWLIIGVVYAASKLFGPRDIIPKRSEFQ